MAKVAKFQLDDGRIAKFEVPDDYTPEQAQEAIKQHFSQPSPQDKADSSFLSRLGYGAMEPFLGTAQLAAKGVELTSPDSGLGKTAHEVSSGIADYAKQMRGAKERMNVGTDVAGVVGNVLSPANLLLASKIPQAATLIGKAAQGAGIGAASGAMMPAKDENFWQDKAIQTGAGGLAGGALSGALSGVSTKLGKVLKPESPLALNSRAAAETDAAVNTALADMNIAPSSIPNNYLAEVRQRVFEGLTKGEKVDAAALLRSLDFNKLGIKPLQGQLTRDPLQFSTEKNLRGAIPEIAMHLQNQEQQLRSKMQNLAGQATDNYQAGSSAINTLKTYDDELRKKIGGLYDQARSSSGKDLDIPLQGLAQDYARIQNDYRTAIPSGVRGAFEDFGLLTGNQTKPFTVEESDHLLKLINRHSGGTDPATNSALSELRDAVKQSVIHAAPDGGVYAPAVKEAAKRFSLHEQVPALDAVYTGRTNADDFVKKFILNGKTDQVKALADVLRGTDLASFEQAKSQIGATLQRAMTGENIVGDAGTSGNSLAKLLRMYGDEKLGAFYSPQEIEELHRLSRVSGYINTFPAANLVNSSNSLSSALMEAPALKGLLSSMSDNAVGKLAGGILKAGAGSVKNNMAANAAMNPKIPTQKLGLTPEQKRLAGLLSSLFSVGAGSSAAGVVGQ